tara:strand:+ start:562 stop:1500 length:939 start_codon:yes stop_codon:yes gene_type:complete
MSRAEFQVIFDGPKLSEGEIDVRELSASLTALGKLFDEADTLLNGDRTTHSLRVKGSFKTGSFKINLTSAQDWVERAKSFLTGDEVGAIVAAGDLVQYIIMGGVGGYSLLKLLKWLAGRKPTTILETDDGSFSVYVGDKYVKVEEAVLKLYQDYKVRKAFEAAIVEPLKEDEIETIAFTDDRGSSFVEATYAERASYASIPEQSEDLPSFSYEANVSLVRISFKEDNKWTVSDGKNAMNVSVEDKAFLRSIDANEIAFSKGDILSVRMRIDQSETSSGLKSEYVIEKVLNHRRPMFRGQLQLDLPDDQSEFD